jgi:hypothetical protein
LKEFRGNGIKIYWLDHTSGLKNLRIWQMFSEKANSTTPLEFAFKKDHLYFVSEQSPAIDFLI